MLLGVQSDHPVVFGQRYGPSFSGNRPDSGIKLQKQKRLHQITLSCQFKKQRESLLIYADQFSLRIVFVMFDDRAHGF